MALIKRGIKGSKLTHAEMDSNFNELDKRSATAYGIFDGTTTPPTIKASHNVSDVIKISNGKYKVVFDTPMNNTDFIVSINGVYDSISTSLSIQEFGNFQGASTRTINDFQIIHEQISLATHSAIEIDSKHINFMVMGGKN